MPVQPLLEGYSFAQKNQLDGLKVRVARAEEDQQKKVVSTDYDTKIIDLNIKDGSHFTNIANLDVNKVTLSNYTDKITELNATDTQRESKLLDLTNDFLQKVSTEEFDGKLVKLNAIAENHDLRLDELEKRSAQVHTSLYETAIEELKKKTDNDIFQAFKQTMENIDIDIGGKITELLSDQIDIDQIQNNQESLISNLLDQSVYTDKKAELISRNQDIEKRLLAVDQFFRVLETTYKIFDENSGLEKKQIIYTAEKNNSITLSPNIRINYKKNNAIAVTLTAFGYNTLTGKISVVNYSGTELGFALKSQFNSISYNKEIELSSIAQSNFGPTNTTGITFRYINQSGEVLETKTLTWQQFQDLPNNAVVSYRDTPITSLISFTPNTTGTIPTYPNNLANGDYFGIVDGLDNWRYAAGTSLDPYPLTPAMNDTIRNLEIVSPFGLSGEDIDGDEIENETMATVDNTFEGVSLTGKAVIIQRGTATFNFKALRAYQAGAKLVIIYNSNSGGDNAIIYSVNEFVGCPVAFIGNAMGERIVKQVRSGSTLYAKYGIGRGDRNTDAFFVYSNLNQEPSYTAQITTPSAPTTLRNLTPTNGLTVDFTANDDGGSPITGYEYNINNGSWNTLNANRIITGLTPDANVDIRIRAVNAIGAGPASTPFNVTIRVEKTYRVFGQSPFDVRNDGVILCSAKDADGNIYIGGDFTLINNIQCFNVARFDAVAQTWGPLGGGTSNPIFAIAVAGTAVYVGGNFANARDNNGDNVLNTSRIAKWNGTAWSAMGRGTSSFVNAIAIDSLDNVYVGGAFTNALDNTGANVLYTGAIAKWDGSAWSALGGGTDNIVNAIAIDSLDNVYVGGAFNTVYDNTGANVLYTGTIAKWDGSAWSAMGAGTSGSVNTIAVVGTDNAIYVGGGFANALDNNGDVVPDTSRIAKWDGEAWSALGGGTSGTVSTIAVGTDNAIYVGGTFANVLDNNGDVVSNTSYIAKWNGEAWSALGGLDEPVNTIVVSGSKIYIGKNYELVYLENNNWNLEFAVYKPGNVLCISSDGLYIGGTFKYVGLIQVNNIAKWNGTAWSALGVGTSGTVNAITIDSLDNVYVGGNFANALDNTGASVLNTSRIAKWNGTAWSAMGRGTSGSVNAIAVLGTTVFIGGSFSTVYSNTGDVVPDTTNIAEWDAGAWRALGRGTSSTVNVIAIESLDNVYIDNVYVGGAFTNALNNTGANVPNTSRIAKWDYISKSWSALGRGTSSNVNAIALYSLDSIYVGGGFANALDNNGDVVPDTSRIAKWDGTAWSAMGGGTSGTVNTIAVVGTGTLAPVYVGGGFPNALDNTGANVLNTSRIAKWDGSAWSALGAGTSSGSVRAIVNNNGQLLIGGFFSKIGTEFYYGVAKYS